MGLLSQMMANLYQPPKHEKTPQTLPKHLTPAKVAQHMQAANIMQGAQSTVIQGQLLRGEVLDLRANQIMVLLENGATVSARTEGTLNLSIGEHARFLVAQTTEDQILLKLAKEDTPAENPMIEKALSAANIQKTERSVSIVTELLSHKQPVNEAGIRHYLSLTAKHPELPVKDLILMELHQIPVTKESVEQFQQFHTRNTQIVSQAENLLTNLLKQISTLPDPALKQAMLQELENVLHSNNINAALGSEQAKVTPVSSNVQATGSMIADNLPQYNQTAPTMQALQTMQADGQLSDISESAAPTQVETELVEEDSIPTQTKSTENITQSLPHDLSHTEFAPASTEPEDFLSEFLKSFLLEPEEIADSQRVKKYYEELDERLTKLEQLSEKLTETTKEPPADTPKQMRSNLSFMDAVNQVFPYVQLPLKFREHPAHGELYVYEKKRALKPSDSLSALLHLELEALGTTDIFITLTGSHVTTRFSMTDAESCNWIKSELPSLSEALAAKGYTLQSEVTLRETVEEDNAPTLLEQFLEKHAPGGLNRYTFDIRA